MNLAEIERTGDEKASAVISHVIGPTFSIYFWRFTNLGELMEEAKEYEVVRNAPREEYETKRDKQIVIETAMSLRQHKGQDKSSFLDEASRANHEV